MVRFAAALTLAISLLGTAVHGSEIMLLDFWSPSCGPCMQMKPVIQALETARYPIRQIDTSRDWQLARQFNVERIPCFVMLVDGKEVDRVVGYTSSEQLQEMFEKAKDIVVQGQRVRGQSPDAKLNAAAADIPRVSAVGPSVPTEPEWPAPQPVPTANAHGAAATVTESTTKLLAATVRLKVEDENGHSFGTGTIVDTRSGDALVVTCGHLFRESKGKGTISVELFDAQPQGVHVADQVPGQLISYDLERDIAMISISPKRAVSVAPVAPPKTSIERGDRVINVGCSNGQDPTILETRVTSRDRYQGPPNIEAAGAPVEGRSGGGLFNMQGQLVGVCFAADPEGNEGLYSALESIHGELDRLGLKDVYAKGDPRSAAGQPIVRAQELAQEPLAPIEPAGSSVPVAESQATIVEGPARAAITPPETLNEAERAAWEEIVERAGKYEVVVIIRPQEPGGESEVITLNGVSPHFAKGLAELNSAPQGNLKR